MMMMMMMITMMMAMTIIMIKRTGFDDGRALIMKTMAEF